MERVTSGNERLDRVLGGGLPAHGIAMLIGEPGTGKTILADQYAFEHATEDRPSLIYSTVSEPYEKMLRFGQELSFFDSQAIGRRVFYDALGPELRLGGLDAVLKRVAEDIKTRRPGMLVIDSFRALAAFSDHQTFRQFLADLADLLSAFPVTSFWIGEYTAVDIAVAPEFAVADTIIGLAQEDDGLRSSRFLQVFKLRGSGFLSGKHACRITEDGLQVFPRLADAPDASAYDSLSTRASSGIPVLDHLIYDGFVTGSTTLVLGPAGVGKTLMGMHFIFGGAEQGEPGVIAALQENPSQLETIIGNFGWSFEHPDVDLLYTSTVDLYVDEWIYRLLDRMEATGAKRILIDSLADIEACASDQIRFREFIYSLIQRCARSGVSAMLTMELPDLFAMGRLTERAFSHVADNVILMQYVERDAELRRAMTVVKCRGSRHDLGIHEFEITADGIVLGDRVTQNRATEDRATEDRATENRAVDEPRGS